jgi:hypothetical protein
VTRRHRRRRHRGESDVLDQKSNLPGSHAQRSPVSEPTEREQIERLEAEARRKDQHIAGLEAAALVTDERIAALIAEIDGLHKAMEHRAVIEQAKGVIMRSTGCGPEAAFAALVAQSQHENRKVREIATELVDALDRSSVAFS